MLWVKLRKYGSPISYNRASNTCTLTCHPTAHNADGSISSVQSLDHHKGK